MSAPITRKREMTSPTRLRIPIRFLFFMNRPMRIITRASPVSRASPPSRER